MSTDENNIVDLWRLVVVPEETFAIMISVSQYAMSPRKYADTCSDNSRVGTRIRARVAGRVGLLTSRDLNNARFDTINGLLATKTYLHFFHSRSSALEVCNMQQSCRYPCGRGQGCLDPLKLEGWLWIG